MLPAHGCSVNCLPGSVRYSDLVAAIAKQAETNVKSGVGVTPTAVAKEIADAIEANRPRTRYLVGRDAKLLGFMSGLALRSTSRSTDCAEPRPTDTECESPDSARHHHGPLIAISR